MIEEGFLSEVLKSKEQSNTLDILDIKGTISSLTYKIERLKNDAKSFILGEGHVASHVHTPNTYLKQLTVLNSEMTELDAKINTVSKHDIDQVTVTRNNLEFELKKTKYSLKIVNQFINFHKNYKELIALINNSDYVDAVKKLAEIRNIIREIEVDENMDIILNMTISISSTKNMLLRKLENIWDQTIKTEVKTDTNIKTATIAVDKDTNELEKICAALYYENSTSEFNCLADFLLDNILTPILNNTVKIELNNEDVEILIVKYKLDSPKMQYELLFDNLFTVFDYLSCRVDYCLDNDLTLIDYIGNRIRVQFCNILIKNYLEDSVPSTEEELNGYKNIIPKINDLDLQLTTNKFFDEECSQLLKKATNIELVFLNKLCQKYVSKADTIFKKDLHDMTEVGVAIGQGDDKGKTSFSKCYISQSTCELLTLLKNILDHAARSSNECADKLLHTSKTIIQNYSVLVPTYHKKLLETIPQQSAIFYNNCMYIAYELVHNEQFYGDKISNEGLAGDSFNYQIKHLQTAGRGAFMTVIKRQTKQIEDILNESVLASLSHEKLDQECNKTIRQCLRQLEVLKTVWQKVLNYEIYNKSMGDLLNFFIEHCIKLVLVAEDISAVNSNLLVEIMTVVQSRGPTLFTESKEVHMYTKSWNKFKELIILLNSSLSNIDDRWADGKGPLAYEFSPEDVRKLIKALFQNTDHRAAVLAKIY